MNAITRRRRAIVQALLLPVTALAVPVAAQFSPLMRYNTVAESMYVLDRCGELTVERRAWLRKLSDLAKGPLDWTADQWAAHDAALAKDLERLYPSVPKERCAELTRSVDQERRNAPAAN
jgi:hypothetical protein